MPDKLELRFNVDLVVRAFGMDAEGHPFSQKVHTQDISYRGAKLLGLEKRLTPNDIIGIQFGELKARCKVIWVTDPASVQKIEAGVEILPSQACPWQAEIAKMQAGTTASISRTAPVARDKRKFPRQKVAFPIEVRDQPGSGAPLRTATADVSGRGCYIETMLPYPVGKTLDITFWLNSQPIHTKAIVRTCDGGFGMGIEFVSLDEAIQQLLQTQLENMAAEGAPLWRTQGAG
ncbi:MAG TPA: PilZ domain-containing protein [Terriglobales bacterium]|jgi:hypothetical protein|nr:PilZ domain-containing protein [Terriglobales bacterium]